MSKLYLVLSFLVLPLLTLKIYSQYKYLGYDPPGEIPEIFAPGVISNDVTGEYSISFSSDGNMVLFSRFNAQNGSNTTWYSEYRDNKWTDPVIPDFARDTYSVEAFFISHNEIIFISDRFHSPQSALFSPQIYTSKYEDSEWTTPTLLSVNMSGNKKMGASQASNGTLYFSQQDDNDITFHIWKCELADGEYKEPVKLAGWINQFPQSGHCYIAPDETYLLFDAATNYPDNWNTSIFISFRLDDNTWDRPVKLSSLINQGDVNYMPYVSPDQKYLFFCRAGNIYWADISRLLGTSSSMHIGMSEQAEKPLLFPNPVKDRIILELNGIIVGQDEIHILNSMGQTVNHYAEIHMISDCGQKILINVQKLEAGMYSLRSISSSELNLKFIKN